MRWAKVDDKGKTEELVAGKPLVVDDVQYTLDIFDIALADETGSYIEKLKSLGVYQIEEPVHPENKKPVSSTVVFELDKVKRVYIYEDIPIPEPEPPRVPVRISMIQLKTVLHLANLLATVEDDIKKSNDRELQLAWDYANDVWINSAMMSYIATLTGQTATQIDALFLQTETLVLSTDRIDTERTR